MSKEVEKLTKQALVERYVERQIATVEEILTRLEGISQEREVTGWMLLECQQLDSSRMGNYTIVPYGPGCTLKEPPTVPISPRGLASDMSVVVAIAESNESKAGPVSWAGEVIADNSGKFCGNALRFATKEEAEGYVLDLSCRWTLVRETRVVESQDPVNYAWVDGRSVEL